MFQPKHGCAGQTVPASTAAMAVATSTMHLSARPFLAPSGPRTLFLALSDLLTLRRWALLVRSSALRDEASASTASIFVAECGARLADPSAGGGGGEEAMRVSFAVPYRCEFGQHIALVGSDEFLGDWDVRRGVPMNWQDGDVWTVDLELPPTCADTKGLISFRAA